MSSEQAAMLHATWCVTGMDCPDCAATLNKALARVPGVI